MIVKNYDIGWGTNWPMKQLEQEILEHTLSKFRDDNSRTVVINSVWYTGDYHQQVMQELRELCPTHIIVVAMLDPPVVKLEWFNELNCEVIGVGYYSNSNVDYFAKFMDRFYQMPNCNLLNELIIDTAYMCLNRKPHPHRLRLYQGLENAGILDSGFVSMGGIPPMRLLDNDVEGQNFAPNGGIEQYGIGNDIASLGNINRWQRHFVNIVTETIYDVDACNFLSEKTFKPILGLRPFFIYAPNGGVECLKCRGFEPYVNDFNDIVDTDLIQPYNVVEFLRVLSGQPKSYWQMKFCQLKEKLIHNKEHFTNYVRQL
jgi:hypothetical protein